MAERLPHPVLQVAFEPSASLPDCLRSARALAQRLHVGVQFLFGPEDDEALYLVQSWMSLEDTLALWDPEHAASVQAHVEAHRG
jgi:hypothetical protein